MKPKPPLIARLAIAIAMDLATLGICILLDIIEPSGWFLYSLIIMWLALVIHAVIGILSLFLLIPFWIHNAAIRLNTWVLCRRLEYEIRKTWGDKVGIDIRVEWISKHDSK